MTDTSVIEKVEVDTKLKEPSLYNVIYMNDDQTSMQFVISSLIRHFDYNEDSSVQKMMEIHESGSAIVATLPYEIAEQKASEVMLEARTLNFPLQLKLKEDA